MKKLFIFVLMLVALNGFSQDSLKRDSIKKDSVKVKKIHSSISTKTGLKKDKWYVYPEILLGFALAVILLGHLNTEENK